MEISVGMFLLLLAFAFACEFIDSSLGMGYGTILTPSLLILGFDPLLVIPSVNIPKIVLETYIGLLVLTMGFIVILNRTFIFTWNKMIVVGLLSAFNKGISGGGFGPVVTAGQILSGQNHKAAIGVATLAEAPICIGGFFTYLIARTVNELPSPILSMPVSSFIRNMFSHQLFQWELILALLLGSVLFTPFGAITTRSLKKSGCILSRESLSLYWVSGHS